MIIYENDEIYIETENSEIPWLKIFTKKEYKELTDIPIDLRKRLWDIYYIVEKEMKHYYNPTKINLASFANILPRVHLHVMARYENDSYFPNPMWGEKLREANLKLPNEKIFHSNLLKALESI